MMNGLSVVIPNYNGIELFQQTLPTVYEALEQYGGPCEIIAVDDASSDGSVAFLQTHYPQVRIIRNEKNSGFAVTANKGIKASRFDLILLLNSDIKLMPDYFHHQLKYFNRPETFGVMGRIIGWNDDILQDAAKYPSFHGYKIKTAGNYILQNENEMRNGVYTMYLSGANALLSKKNFEACGNFNELFSPFYVEDYELSIRAWRLGYKCYYDHYAVCRHKTSSSINRKNTKKNISAIYNRNKFFLHGIHLGRFERYVYYLQLIPETLVRMLTGRFSYLQSIKLFFSDYEKVRQSRKQLLKQSGGKIFTVKQVSDFIKDSVKDKKIIRF
jgi:GT2 family glycosyltransferase